MSVNNVKLNDLIRSLDQQGFLPEISNEDINDPSQAKQVDLAIYVIDRVTTPPELAVQLIGALFKEHVDSANKEPMYSSYISTQVNKRRAFQEKSPILKAVRKQLNRVGSAALKQTVLFPNLPLDRKSLFHIHSFLSIKTVALLSSVSKKYFLSQWDLLKNQRKELSNQLTAIEDRFGDTLDDPNIIATSQAILTNVFLQKKPKKIPLEWFANAREVDTCTTLVKDYLTNVSSSFILCAKERSLENVKKGMSNVTNQSSFTLSWFTKHIHHNMEAHLSEIFFSKLNEQMYGKLMLWKTRVMNLITNKLSRQDFIHHLNETTIELIVLGNHHSARNIIKHIRSLLLMLGKNELAQEIADTFKPKITQAFYDNTPIHLQQYLPNFLSNAAW